MDRTRLKMLRNKQNITQIALEAGFQTHAAFDKAFKEMFGVNPTEYKEDLNLKRKEYQDIEPIRIEEIESFEVYTIRHIGPYEMMPKIWGDFMEFAHKNQLINQNFACYGISHDSPEISDNEKLRYDLCTTQTKPLELKNSEVQTKTIEGGRYAVFEHKGDRLNLINTYNRVLGNWLYKSNANLRAVPIFHKIFNFRMEVEVKELYTEIYLPIE